MNSLSKIFYKAFLYLYSGAFTAYIPIVYLKKVKRSFRNKLYRKRWSERFGDTKFRLKNSIWIHSVSVGESLSAEPLVKRMLKQHPDTSFIITTTTPTGSDIIKKLYAEYDNVYHTYIPYDIKTFVAKFIARVNPKIFIVIETEIWPNIIEQCYEDDIPVIITNARLSKKSFRNYKKIPYAAENLFNKISHISTQTYKDTRRFLSLGINKEKISLTGNLKYSLEIPNNIEDKTKELKKSIANRPVWIAASTHKGEEELILSALAEILKKIPNCLLILVPRHKERFDTVSHLIDCHSLKQQRRTKTSSSIDGSTQVYLGDTMGELLYLYYLADIAFVGGSLIENGGHNILEPAALAKAIVSGPSLFNFNDIANSFKIHDAIKIVNNEKELSSFITKTLQNKEELSKYSQNAYKAFKQNSNVVDNQLEIIERYIK